MFILTILVCALEWYCVAVHHSRFWSIEKTAIGAWLQNFNTLQEITMYDVSEKLSSASKTSVETLVNMANTAFGGMERLAALNLNAARTLMEDGAANTRALLGVKDVQGLVSLQTMMAQPGLQKATVYSRSVCRIAADTQEALSEVVEGQVCELSQSANQALDEAAKTAPPGADLGVNAMRSVLVAANSAYDSMSRAAKQVTEMAEATLADATVVKSSRKPV